MPVKILLGVFISMLILKAGTSTEVIGSGTTTQPTTENRSSGTVTNVVTPGTEPTIISGTFNSRNFEIYLNLAARP